MGHGLDGAEIAVIDGLVGEAVEEPSHLVLVGRSNGPETDRQVVPEGVNGGYVFRVEPARAGEIDLITVQNVRFPGFFHEKAPIVRVGDVNEGQGPFPDGPSPERGDAVVRDDKVDGLPVGELVGVGVHRGQDVGLSFEIAAWQGHDGSAAPGVNGAGDQFLDFPGSGGDIPFSGVEGDVARQIDFPGGNDGHETVIEADASRVGYDVDSLKFHQGVSAKPAHELLRPLGIGGQRLSPEKPFFPVCHRAALDQVHEGVGEKKGLDSQVPFPRQGLHEGFEKGAEEEAEAASVLDDGRHVSSETVKGLVRFPPGKIERRFLGPDDELEVRHVYEGVPQGKGVPVAHFTHHEPGVFHGVAGHVHGGAEAAETPVIGRRDLDEGGVQPDHLGAEKIGNPRKAIGDEIDPSRRDRLTGDPSAEKGPEPVFLDIALVQGDGVTEAEKLDQVKVLQVGKGGRHEMPDQGPRLGHAGSEKDAHARLDLGQNGLGRDDFFLPL